MLASLLIVTASSVHAATYSNTGPIAINDNSTASPYPSTITVAAEPITSLADLTVTLYGFSHACPWDVDILVVGPTGAGAILMSDVGTNLGCPDSVGADLTFSDSASNSVPYPPVTGTWLPTNEGSGDDFSAGGGPSGTFGTSLSVFDGSNPNGTWSLYVIDQNNIDVGQIAGGWSIAFTEGDTTDPVVNPIQNQTLNPTSPAGAPVLFNVSATDDVTPANELVIACEDPNGSPFQSGNVAPIGTTVVTCSATDKAGNTGSTSFTVTVLGADDLFATWRADTINLVSNVTAERALLATIDQAERAYRAGNPLGAYFAVLQYIVQLDSYQAKRTVPASAVWTLANDAKAVLDAMM